MGRLFQQLNLSLDRGLAGLKQELLAELHPHLARLDSRPGISGAVLDDPRPVESEAMLLDECNGNFEKLAARFDQFEEVIAKLDDSTACRNLGAQGAGANFEVLTARFDQFEELIEKLEEQFSCAAFANELNVDSLLDALRPELREVEGKLQGVVGSLVEDLKRDLKFQAIEQGKFKVEQFVRFDNVDSVLELLKQQLRRPGETHSKVWTNGPLIHTASGSISLADGKRCAALWTLPCSGLEAKHQG